MTNSGWILIHDIPSFILAKSVILAADIFGWDPIQGSGVLSNYSGKVKISYINTLRFTYLSSF